MICVKLQLFSYPSGKTSILGAQKEPSYRDGSFEYRQHMFWLRNKKNNFQLSTLILGPDVCLRTKGLDCL